MTKIEYRTLNDRAYEEIKQGLMAATFAPGQTLIIRTLAETYGISTTPVREALQRLVAERFLVMLPNRTITVPALETEKFVELLHIRCALEGLAAELATRHIGKAQLKQLRKLFKDIGAALQRKDYDAYRSLNQAFHFTIYDQAGSPRLLQLIQDMWGQVGPYMKELFADGYEGRANDEHRRIIEAIEAGDAAALRDHVVTDISVAAEFLIPRLRQLEDARAEPFEAVVDLRQSRERRAAQP